MIVISDTSVVSNLIVIGQLDLLKVLFRNIVVPTAVHHELMALRAFEVDLSPYLSADWVAVMSPTDVALVKSLKESLDQGESKAIVLAQEHRNSLLAIDEKAGRKIAQYMGIDIIGLVGILIRAKETGAITAIKPLLDQVIQQAGFYLSPRFYQQILSDHGE
ncbi:MAG: DUF3368 domain-containing protein [Bacteroidia bacterium]